MGNYFHSEEEVVLSVGGGVGERLGQTNVGSGRWNVALWRRGRCADFVFFFLRRRRRRWSDPNT